MYIGYYVDLEPIIHYDNNDKLNLYGCFMFYVHNMTCLSVFFLCFPYENLVLFCFVFLQNTMLYTFFGSNSINICEIVKEVQ